MASIDTSTLYSVETANGDTYGPVELKQLKLWVKERRIGDIDLILMQDGSPPIQAGIWPPLQYCFKGEQGDETIATIIPYRNTCALVGYYLGIFSIFPILGIPMAIAGFVLGIKGYRYRKQNPQAHGKAHSIVAIVGSCIGFLVNILALVAIYVGMSS